jgi:hypothetical protein
MRSWLVVVVCVAVAGCTKHNPRACQADGTCSEASLPFCDVQGTLGGGKNECIAVTCTANEFAECRDNTEVRCNADGTNYDLTACERVCEASLGGCRLCDANESACTNSTFATCDANGTVISSTKCGLGCFDATRCKEINASNGLSVYRDMVAHPPDLDLSAGARIDTLTGLIEGVADPVPTFLVPAPPNGVAIRVFVVNQLRVGDLALNEYQPTNMFDARPALAIIATGDIHVNGRISLVPLDMDVSNSPPVPGQRIAVGQCSGVDGQVFETQGMNELESGGGGAGHATAGADGGDLSGLQVALGGQAGAMNGTSTLEPLRGGCNGGSSGVHSGGGAIQLTSNSAIYVSGTINASGLGGRRPAGGGGSGGAILLEAPIVEISDTGKLIAVGGGGASRDHSGQTSDDGSVALGGACEATSMYCGRGGDGATGASQATAGENQAVTTDADTTAGGGGGGVGRIRINTQSGMPVQSPTAVVAGVVSTGTTTVR